MFQKTFDEHFEHLRLRLDTIDPKSIEAVTSLRGQTPRTVGDVRKLLGFLSYFWRWFPQFAAIAKPLYDLTSTPKEPKTQQKTHTWKRNNKLSQFSSSIQVQWTEDHQLAVEKLISHLIEVPFLTFQQYDKPFAAVHVDACEYGLGTAVCQRQDGRLRVMAYGSWTFTPAEKNYSLHSGKLEFLTLKWSATEFFRDYLYCSNDFVVYTDNNPLTYVLPTAKLNVKGIRWFSELVDFKFKIRYRQGTLP